MKWREKLLPFADAVAAGRGRCCSGRIEEVAILSQSSSPPHHVGASPVAPVVAERQQHADATEGRLRAVWCGRE